MKDRILASYLKDFVEEFGLADLEESAAERTRAFTEALTEAAARAGRAAPGVADHVLGTVKVFSDLRGWGFISCDGGGDVFAHYTGIAGAGFRTLREGQRVKLSTVETARGVQAVDVEPA